MKTLTAQLTLGAIMLVPASMFAQYTEGTINIPGATVLPTPYGIDAKDQIAGTFADSNGTHGFLLSQGVLVQIDQPGAAGTWMMGIDSVKGIVGYETTLTGYLGIADGGRQYKLVRGGSDRRITGINATGTFVGYDGSARAFINAGGVYTSVVPAPCAGLQAPIAVYLNGVNAHNDLVGYCNGFLTPSHGFARVGGVDQEITVFGNAAYPTGINDSGAIAGWFGDGSGQAHGFVLSGTTITQFDFQGPDTYPSTLVYAINNKGSLVGQAYDSTLGGYVGFYALTN
jgi:hypothetical protein